MSFNQQIEASQMIMYQNHGYRFERDEIKTLVLDIVDQGVVGKNPLTTGTKFSINLFEPLIIDKLSDIYLDSVLTHNCLVNTKNTNSALCLKIDEFNIRSNCASTTTTSSQHLFNSILIPNENNNIDNHFSTVIHKGKKMNYICSINPSSINSLSGVVTDLEGNSAWTGLLDNINISTAGLFYIKLASATEKFVEAGSKFTFDAGVTPTNTIFKTVNDMLTGSDDLYFVHVDTGVDPITIASLGVIQSDGNNSTDSTGLHGIRILPLTFNNGTAPRFMAEFIIVSRK